MSRSVVVSEAALLKSNTDGTFDIIKSDEGSDPASVAYKALLHAKKNSFDYLIIDTAGRLQNKKN